MVRDKPKRKPRTVPAWLADVLDCPTCGTRRYLGPSGANCPVPACIKIEPRAGVLGSMLDAHDDFVRLATARGDKRIIARKPAVKLGWAYLRRSIHRKPPDKGER